MSATGKLDGRHALVTGAGGGIGAAIARALASEGARVSLAGRRRGAARGVARNPARRRAAVVDGFDVADAKAVARGLAAARAAFGPVAILVNNAGEAPSAPFDKTDLALWRAGVRGRSDGVYLVTRAALAESKARRAGAHHQRRLDRRPRSAMPMSPPIARPNTASSASRARSRSNSRETGVTVNAVCPGFTETPLIDRAVDNIVAKTGRTEEAAQASWRRPIRRGGS